MSSDQPIIRDCLEADMAAVGALYADFVTGSLRSFEVEPPDCDEMRRRWQNVSAHGLPYLVAEAAGRIAGFAYATPYHSRPGYRYTVENSVYVAPDSQGRGIGRLLLSAVIAGSEARGMRQMIAIITDADADASMALHRGQGFDMAGRLKTVGRKEGQWLDIIMMQRPLGDGASAAPPDESAGAPA